MSHDEDLQLRRADVVLFPRGIAAPRATSPRSSLPALPKARCGSGGCGEFPDPSPGQSEMAEAADG